MVREIVNVYIANKSGPSILPCGMPEETGRKFELLFYADTLATVSKIALEPSQ